MDRTDESKYHIPNEGPIYGQIIGEGNQITQHFYNPGDASTPSKLQQRVCNIPYPPNPYFTGREEMLSRLETTLQTGQPAALSQPQAISGLGGIGKTQIALAYAYQHLQDYQAVLWSRADTTEALISGFAKFAEVLQLPQKDEKDQLIVVKAVKNWLKTHDHWLLILDNADDLAVVRDFLPSSGTGHTLLTTRAASTGRLANRLEVEVLDQDVGALFVLRRAGILAADASLDQAELGAVSLARELVREMGGLPLALDQAGAYIEEVQCSLSDYLKLYRQYRAELLKERGGLVPDHPEPVATTWSLSFHNIEESNPAAADLLRACAFLYPDEIPEEIFIKGGKYLGSLLEIAATNALSFNKSISILLDYSLTRRNPATRTLTIHRLVQAVIQDRMDKQTRQLWAERTTQAVALVFPVGTYETWLQCERCLTQIQICVRLIEQHNVALEDTVLLLAHAGYYLIQRARYTEAEPLLKLALQRGKQCSR